MTVLAKWQRMPWHIYLQIHCCPTVENCMVWNHALLSYTKIKKIKTVKMKRLKIRVRPNGLVQKHWVLDFWCFGNTRRWSNIDIFRHFFSESTSNAPAPQSNMGSNSLEIYKLLALRNVSSLMRDIPEGEKNLLSMILNKIGSPSKKKFIQSWHLWSPERCVELSSIEREKSNDKVCFIF